MAKFESKIPYDILQQLDKLSQGKMEKEMLQAAGKMVKSRVESNMHRAFKKYDSLEQGLRLTRVYETPSDDGLNIKIEFDGYDENHIPIPLKALAREYGTSRGEAKKPFMRKSFRKAEIEQIMQSVQDKYIKGDQI